MELIRRYGKIFLGPALLETEIGHEPPLERLHYAFDRRTNWREPLSASSFLAWRSGLAKKRDSGQRDAAPRSLPKRCTL